MDSSRKSLRAYSIAQNIKKEIDDTLFKVELEKRRFLALEREETHLKDSYDKKLKVLNQLKAKEPDTKTHSTRVWQTANIINNVDRSHLALHDQIQQHKRDIATHRRQIYKYKQMCNKLKQDIEYLSKVNNDTNTQNVQLDQNNVDLKNQIMDFRQNNIKNSGEFFQSFSNVNKSDLNDENERRKFSMRQKNFLGEEMKNSKIVPFQNLSDALRESGMVFSDHIDQIMTESLPVAKERIKTQIYKNKEKLKISENYKRFGENLEEMFQVMKEYKGRDDLDFIAEEFVTKERQLQKIEEYIGQLESRILKAQLTLKNRKRQDDNLKKQVCTQVQKPDKHYAQMQGQLQKEISELKKKESDFYEWFTKVNNILLPLTDQTLTRGNAANLIGDIEQSLNVKTESPEKKNPGKMTVPTFDPPDHRQNYNELLSYEKMREMANDYVKSKKP